MSAIESWYEEKQSAYLYRSIAQAETHQPYRSLFLSLANAADSQAQIWVEQHAKESSVALPNFKPSVRAKVVAFITQYMGPRRVRPMLAAMKVRGISVYRGPVKSGHVMPTSVEDVGHRHKGVESGGNLRAAVFGVNDGLVSNASLVMGIAGATSDTSIIFLSGIAGMLAGAFSMAAGEYISMRSQRELYEYQIGLERDELNEYPEEEAEELALIYNARGVPMETARQTALQIIQDKENALATLSREELGLNPDDLGSPSGAAISSFVAFALGAVVPLLPFLLQLGGIMLSVAMTLLSLFVVGVVLSLFTGRNAWLNGLRMMGIGGAAGAVTYLVGKVLGVTLS